MADNGATDETGEANNPNTVFLYIRASLIDKKSKGSCPTSHQWFLAAYVLHQNHYFNLTVKTVTPGNPPEDYQALTGRKKLPIIKVESGPNGEQDLEVDDLENFLDIWKCEQMAVAKYSAGESEAELVIANMYRNLNAFLLDQTSNPSLLLASLEKLNTYLSRTSHTKFLLNDDLSYADCQLIPKLHHLVISAKAYKDFEIPSTMEHVWKYLAEVYKTVAFQKSCPSDEDIIAHYEKKAKTSKKDLPNPYVCKEFTYTWEIPENIINGS
ncbi:chloride intracellular channel Clic-like [Tubulanus polymorphus]|uniref:chloride intracellular channel Clic-like n=1 Tax=Tubulanus polymorphus TaxID=672921 RepID=UPI003DA35868